MDFSSLKALWDKKPYNGHVAAYLPNVFAIGTLAYNPEHIIRKKVYKDMPFEPNWNMRVGTAVHEFVQRRLGEGWNHEQEIWYDFPYQWKSINATNITLFGSIDSINFVDHIIVEYKTSRSNDNTILPHYKLQASGYAKMCGYMYHSDFEAHIIKIPLVDNNDIIDYILSKDEIENGWNSLLGSAVSVADKMDVLLSEINQAKEEKKAGKR